jgi:hypothetical protein
VGKGGGGRCVLRQKEGSTLYEYMKFCVVFMLRSFIILGNPESAFMFRARKTTSASKNIYRRNLTDVPGQKLKPAQFLVVLPPHEIYN